jgi:Arm DNA-binding domain
MDCNPSFINSLKQKVMWSKRFSLLFYLRKPKNYVRGKQLVYMRITIDAARLELSAQRECEPERWNSRAGRTKGTKEEIQALNAYLDSLQAKVYEAHRSLVDNNEQVTVESFRTRLRGTSKKGRMILEVFQHHNDQLEQLVGKEFAAGTLERYKTSLEHSPDFIQLIICFSW